MTGVANVKPNVISRFISCALFAQWIYMEEIDTICFPLVAGTVNIIANLTQS